ncbi:MAG: hypothetical protein K8T90_19875 [Planctomycetes bacterium]|nr:hypothetical protein [Planctomycetota bacterium]
MRVRTVIVCAALLVVAVAVAAVAFVCGHPGWFPWAFQYSRDWRGALVAQTDGADGLRIHSYDRDRQFDFQPHSGTVLFETHDADVARELLDLVRIADRASGDHCLCIGGDEVDVLRGDSVAASFQFQHGRSLRSLQLWPGDATLTAESAEAVCAWFGAHGMHVESPQQAAARIDAATRALEAAQDASVGPARSRALRACHDRATAEVLLAEWFPEQADRVVLVARFLSARSEDARGDAERAYDNLHGWLLKADDFATVARTAERMLASESEALRGAVLFCDFGGRVACEFPEQTIPDLQMRVARILVGSSSEEDRCLGLKMLYCIGDTPDVRALLVGLLPPAGDGEFHGPSTESQMRAAGVLAGICDPSLFTRLRALAVSSGDRSRWTADIERRIAARADGGGSGRSR